MSQYDNPKELIVNFQDVDSKIEDLSKDLLALFVEVDHELVDVLVYAVREHFAVIPYKPQRTIKFTLRNLYRHETIGDAKLRMSLLNNFDGSLEQVLYLDGNEKYRLESTGSEDQPSAVLVYEWRDPDPDPEKDQYDEYRYAVEQARASHLETEDRMKEVEFTFAHLARNAVENMLIKQFHVNDFKEVTEKQHETSKKILEDARGFADQERDALRGESDKIDDEVKRLEAELKRLEQEINKESQTNKNQEDDLTTHAPIKTNSNWNRDTDGRHKIQEEVSQTTNEIAELTLKNVNKAKEDGLLGGLTQTETKLALFDDILHAQGKSKDAKNKLDDTKVEIRGLQCQLAEKEFDLQQLENESKRLGQLDRDLGMRIREGDEALQAMLADRKDAKDRGDELANRAKYYEDLLAQIEKEVEGLKADSESRKDVDGKDLFKDSGLNNPEIQKLQKELDDAERGRDEALNKLEAMEGAWIESVEEVSKEAEKLAADTEDTKFNKDVQKHLKDILDHSNKQADLYQNLEILDQEINLCKIGDSNEIASEFAKDVKIRNDRLVKEEGQVAGDIETAAEASSRKENEIQQEADRIPGLEETFLRLLRERDDLHYQYEELLRRKEERDYQEGENEKRYQKELAEYERRMKQFKQEIKQLKDQIGDTTNAVNNLKPQIEDLEDEYDTWIEKIKIKRTINKKKQEEDEMANTYYAAPGDEIDELIGQYKNSKATLIPVKRIEPGEYMFGTMRVQIKKEKKHKSGYQVTILRTMKRFDLDDFVKKEANKELEKLQKINEDEEMVVDESEKTELRKSPGGRKSSTNSPARGTAGRDHSNVVTTDKIRRQMRA